MGKGHFWPGRKQKGVSLSGSAQVFDLVTGIDPIYNEAIEALVGPFEWGLWFKV